MSELAISENRITNFNQSPPNPDGSCVIYWMSRDKRAVDNWALEYAIGVANSHKVPLIVAFFVTDRIGEAYRQVRHYDFMLKGLAETARALRNKHIGFIMRKDLPDVGVVKLAQELDPIIVITDQDYGRGAKRWRRNAGKNLHVRLEAVDANAIVPPNLFEKELYAAYVIRPKLQRLYDDYITEYSSLKVNEKWSREVSGLPDQEPELIMSELDLLRDALPVPDRTPGTEAGMQIVQLFIEHGITTYKDGRNDPAIDAQSNLSAYLHFGQISAQRVAYDLLNGPYGNRNQAIDSFFNEMIVWRELCINYCKYNNNYDNFAGLTNWAQNSLIEHSEDEREYIYTYKQLEAGDTHDELWNAAQHEMVYRGKMHGYLRMYWAKKLLEWTESPQQAISWAIKLNDTYELDGREPNGWNGVLWAIGGLHDRPWFEREIFGKIRYMNYNGAKKKFSISGYIKRVSSYKP